MGGPEAVETQRLMAVTAALVAALAASLHAATAAPPHVISVIVDECVPTPDPTPKAESRGVKRVLLLAVQSGLLGHAGAQRQLIHDGELRLPRARGDHPHAPPHLHLLQPHAPCAPAPDLQLARPAGTRGRARSLSGPAGSFLSGRFPVHITGIQVCPRPPSSQPPPQSD